MNIFRMLRVAIKNYKQNFRVCFLYGTLIPLAVSFFTSLPVIAEMTGINVLAFRIISTPFSLASAVILPSVSILPVITALTKPSADGPFTFKERFSAKFLPFTILNILALLVFGVAVVILAVAGTIYVTINSLIGSGIGFQISLIPILLLVFVFSITSETILMYSYIALTTENIKVSSAFAKGFKMFFKNLLRGVGHYLFFGTAVMLVPAAFAVMAIVFSGSIPFLPVYNTTLTVVFTIISTLLSLLLTPVFTSCMIESYRKNWLLAYNIPLNNQETEEEIFETPDDETIYL